MSRELLLKYGGAVLFTISAILLKVFLVPIDTAADNPFALLSGAVMVSAWTGGLGPAVLAMAISLGFGIHTFQRIPEAADYGWVTPSTLFLMQGSLIAFLVSMLRRGIEVAESSRLDALRALRSNEEAENLLQRIVQISEIGVCSGTLGGLLTRANPSLLRMLSLPEDYLEGHSLSWRSLTPPEFSTKDAAAVAQIRLLGHCEPFEKEFVNAKGERVPVMVVGVKDDADVDGFVAFVFDLSVQRKAELEWKAAHQERELATRTKVDFLANTSHELRTPLNAVLGMTQLALQEDISPTVRNYLLTSFGHARELLRLLSDVLDFAQMASGQLSLSPEEFSLRDMMRRLRHSLIVKAAEKQLQVVVDIPNDIPDAVIGDSLRLRQLLSQLAHNAIKFTEQGHVNISIARGDGNESAIELIFEVEDTGVGVAPDFTTQMTEPFSQEDTSSTREKGGVGLGLAIADRIAQMMNGRIWYESQEGVGSKFYARVVLSLGSDPLGSSYHSIDAEPLKNTLILISGDELPQSQANQGDFQRWGMQTQVSTNVSTVLEQISALPLGHPKFYVFIPSSRAGLKVQDLERVARSTPSPLGVVVVESALEESISTSTLADLSNFYVLRDSYTLDDLKRVLLSFRPKFVEENANRSPQKGQTSPQPLHVLIAEDMRVNQLVLQRALAKRGHTVAIANNGREAVDLWKEKLFDLVLMDVQMPALDGLEATREIRSLEAEKKCAHRTPVLAITAHAMQGDYQRCLDAGMDDYMAKPIDVTELIKRVEVMSKSSERANEGKMSEDEPHLLDVDSSLKRMGGDREILVAAAGFFLEDAPGLLEAAAAAFQSGDSPSLRRSAHSLKGLASNFGSTIVVDAALAVEELAATDRLEEAEIHLREMKASTERLMARLERFIAENK